MANPELPEEILIEIFSRLPTKSVGKCRCLSKPWRSLLSNSQFIKTHLNRNTHKENLILTNPSHSVHTIATIRDDTVSKKLELPNTWSQVIGSCDGLVLLINENEKLLVNPITLQYVRIPNSPLALKREWSFEMFGFGYDSSSDDYKIVTLSFYDLDHEPKPRCFNTFVDVYSLKTGVWRRVDSSPYDHGLYEPFPGAFVNGSIHWLACRKELGYPSVITAFDLADEVFDEIPAPIGVDGENFVPNKLVVLGGCLCMVDARINAPTDIWIMKEYGLRDSWTKFSVDIGNEWDAVKALCFTGDDAGVVLLTDEGKLVVHDMKEGTLRDMVVDGVPAVGMDGRTFVETLLDPHFSNT